MRGVRVVFKGSQLASATLEPEHQRLMLRRIAGGTEVTVPRLGLHAMVLAES